MLASGNQRNCISSLGSITGVPTYWCLAPTIAPSGFARNQSLAPAAMNSSKLPYFACQPSVCIPSKGLRNAHQQLQASSEQADAASTQDECSNRRTCRVFALQTNFPFEDPGRPVSKARPSYAPLECTASIMSCHP